MHEEVGGIYRPANSGAYYQYEYSVSPARWNHPLSFLLRSGLSQCCSWPGARNGREGWQGIDSETRLISGCWTAEIKRPPPPPFSSAVPQWYGEPLFTSGKCAATSSNVAQGSHVRSTRAHTPHRSAPYLAWYAI